MSPINKETIKEGFIQVTGSKYYTREVVALGDSHDEGVWKYFSTMLKHQAESYAEHMRRTEIDYIVGPAVDEESLEIKYETIVGSDLKRNPRMGPVLGVWERISEKVSGRIRYVSEKYS